MRNVTFILVLLVLITTACAAPSEQTAQEGANDVVSESQQLPETTSTALSPASDTPVPTSTATPSNTPPPTDTPTPTNTPAPTATSTPTPTATQLPDELVGQIEQSYKALVLTQAIAEVLNETAVRIQAGEVEGFEAFGYLIAVGAMAKGLDEGFAEITPPEFLDSSIADAAALNLEVRRIISRWLDEEIDSAQVVEEMAPLLASIEETVTSAEEILAGEFDRDPEDLSNIRREAIATVYQIFE